MPQLFASVNTSYNYMIVSYTYTGIDVEYFTIERSVDSGAYQFLTQSTEMTLDYIDHNIYHGVYYSYKLTGYDAVDDQVTAPVYAGRTPVFTEWVLKDTDNYNDSETVNLFIDGSRPLEVNNREDLAVFNPLGRKYPVVIRDNEVKGDRIPLTLQFLTQAEYEKFDLLRQKQKQLNLSGPRQHYNWYGVFAQELQRQVLNDADGYSLVSIDFIETGNV